MDDGIVGGTGHGVGVPHGPLPHRVRGGGTTKNSIRIVAQNALPLRYACLSLAFDTLPNVRSALA